MKERKLSDLDLDRLFDNESDYGRKCRFGEITDELIQRAEALMGYRIPASYRELLEYRNGGSISDKLSESWLSVIYGISEDPSAFNGLENMYDNWKNGWEYPDIGIPFGETASAGHDMYYMDFRVTDESGEPRIVRIDNEFGNEVYFVADDLHDFLRMILADEKPEEKLLDPGQPVATDPVRPKTTVQMGRPMIILLAVIDVLLVLLLLITWSIPAARIVIGIMILLLTPCILYFRKKSQP